ncbi:hypothetical protein BABINDRAFT_160638 [Babjeviella inositovora NRRL Y-12698]|uniref:PUM-HD domain-containing protein n=1 Tax=Babjeviella inositovora NRRL Y-12698 TaxID=984486 RepID=A0A1E3QUB3_9ASCO|nr:uncharacterized protein BABINDRAFT_160638 [Babjeviella inositovora NRRL Y-12698]ODQ81266.1 hypothetical protein BABINDRAFT_160638 [Babjeviella inositovora NRRL Y-12698]
MGITNKNKRSAPEPAASKKAKTNAKQAKKVESESEADSEDLDISDSEDLDISDDELDTPTADSDDDLDELDNTSVTQNGKDEENSDLSADEDQTESGEAKPVDPNKKSSKEAHAEQRKMLSERKMQRKAGVEVQQVKLLWEKLRIRKPTPPKEVRDKLCDEIWELASEVIKDLVMKHDASRVVQTLVKYSSKERRDTIVASLRGNFYELATSAYGKYLLIKLLHYGSKESREMILDELHGKLRRLMRHREGAYVVEDLYTLYATVEQKHQMIREFWGSEYALFKEAGQDKDIIAVCAESTEKRTLIAKNLVGTISASVEKGSTGFQILHAAMREYVQIFEGKEVSEFIELLAEQFAELVHTPEGCEVACTLIARANAKERKTIIRSLKSHALKLIKNEHGNMVLTVLMMCVDDTVLVGKTFTAEFAEEMHNLVKDKFSRRPFLYLLNGLDPRFFSPTAKKDLLKYQEISLETSKKPQNQRRGEVLKIFTPAFLDAINEHLVDVLAENMGAQFITELVLKAPADEDPEVAMKKSSLLENIIGLFRGDVLEEFHIINKPFSTRLLKTLIQGGAWNNATKQIEVSEVAGIGAEFATALLESIEGQHKVVPWLQSPGSFVIVSIYESLEKNDKKKFKEFSKTLQKVKKEIQEAAMDDNKGAKLLLTLLEK